jgi:hypothetical protein
MLAHWLGFPRGRWLPLWSGLLVLIAAGCGDGSGVGVTYPVRGQITMDGAPWNAKTTTVLFKPDAAKGNMTTWEPAATVDKQGNYTLRTGGKKGAPPGWYRVIVTATGAPAPPAKGVMHHRPLPKSLLPAKYGQAKTTDLLVEVVEQPSPGAYDLKLTR